MPYLNAKPLVWGIESGVRFEVPAVLSETFARGELDVALLPVFDVFRMRGARVVDGVSISARGPVKSVFVAHRGPLADVKEIVLDSSSRTSVNLLRILLAKKLGVAPSLVVSSPDVEAARLLIGDPALKTRGRLGADWTLTDLGEEWFAWTGLPFVFAVWVLQAGSSDEVARGLRHAASQGLGARETIVAATPDNESALDYLTTSIRFGLADEEKKGMQLFLRMLIEEGILDSTASMPTFV